MKTGELVVKKLFDGCKNGRAVAQLHSLTLKLGLSQSSYFVTKLTVLYANHVSLLRARKLFDEMHDRTVYLWNAVLRSHCRENEWKYTLYLFHDMICSENVHDEKPDNFTIPIVLKACAGLRKLKHGEMVHGLVKKNERISKDMFVGSALIELYSKCGRMDCARKVFEEFSQPDVVLWTSMVTGYEQSGIPETAVEFFTQMVVINQVNPGPITLTSLVSACGQLSSYKLGSSIHGFMTRRGFNKDLSLVNSILNLYAQTGSIKVAETLFKKMEVKDVISWSSMIACYTRNRSPIKAIDIFNEMLDKRIEYNAVTLVSALQACSESSNLDMGKRIHELAATKGYELDISVSTALINMYMKSSLPDQADAVFEKMPKKDVVSWAAMLSGYSQNGMAFKSMEVFKTMLRNNTAPDAVAMVKILTASSNLGILQQAICLHGYLIRSGFFENVFVEASLIELYSKCGEISHALKVFEGTIEKDVVIWSAMISGYGIHGQGRQAIKLFNKMIKQNPEANPNEITFLSVLSACSHTGLVEEGLEVFNMMLDKYRLKPSLQHYGIIVDLLGRRGELDTALDVITKMPFPAGPHVWGALLGACRIHHNMELGEVAAKNLFELDPNQGGHYVLLSNIYAVDEKWDNVAKIRRVIKCKGLKQAFGQSVVENRSGVRSFVADDKLHPETEQVYGLLRNLEVNMREDSYVEMQIHDAETVI